MAFSFERSTPVVSLSFIRGTPVALDVSLLRVTTWGRSKFMTRTATRVIPMLPGPQLYRGTSSMRKRNPLAPPQGPRHRPTVGS